MTYCVIFGKPFKLGILNLLLRNEVDSFLSHTLAFVKQAMSFLLCIKLASPLLEFLFYTLLFLFIYLLCLTIVSFLVKLLIRNGFLSSIHGTGLQKYI